MVIGTALVDMYGKCGYVKKAFDVFKGMPKMDVLAWTSMISALALNGYANEAFDLFTEMVQVGVRPNAVTFSALLSACAHSGLVEKCCWCFDVMKHDHGIEPQVQHYACTVDILSREGLFLEAEELIRSMPMKPGVFVWGALLGGCQLHGNVKLRERIAQYLIDLEPTNHALCINLCDAYAKAGRFDDLKRIRALMKDQEINKSVPGCSMIEIDSVVYEFCMKGSPGIMIEVLKSLLMVLSNEMKISDRYEYFSPVTWREKLCGALKILVWLSRKMYLVKGIIRGSLLMENHELVAGNCDLHSLYSRRSIGNSEVFEICAHIRDSNSYL